MNLLERVAVTAPVFFIGMPRSGTTVIFEAFARHPRLGWPSNFNRSYPTHPWLNASRRVLDNSLVNAYGHKNQYGRKGKLSYYLPQPSEAYNFWNAVTEPDFSRDWMRKRAAPPQVAEHTRSAATSILRWQGKHRFTAKLTGPSRIEYLSSIFPDAYFIHVIRDGRAVVDSLLRVDFWQARGGFEGPFWRGGLDEKDNAMWEENDRDPGVLTGLQWRKVIEVARLEAANIPGHYMEVRYETLMKEPHEEITRMFMFCGLNDESRAHRQIRRGAKFHNMNNKFRENFDAEYLAKLTPSMQPLLQELGYI